MTRASIFALAAATILVAPSSADANHSGQPRPSQDIRVTCPLVMGGEYFNHCMSLYNKGKRTQADACYKQTVVVRFSAGERTLSIESDNPDLKVVAPAEYWLEPGIDTTPHFTEHWRAVFPQPKAIHKVKHTQGQRTVWLQDMLYEERHVIQLFISDKPNPGTPRDSHKAYLSAHTDFEQSCK